MCQCLNNVRVNRRGNLEWTIQKNWPHRVHKDENNQNKEHATICVGHHYVKQTSINNVNKT